VVLVVAMLVPYFTFKTDHKNDMDEAFPLMKVKK